SYLRTLTEVSIPNGHLPLWVAALGGLPARSQADICRQLSPAVRAALLPELCRNSQELRQLLSGTWLSVHIAQRLPDTPLVLRVVERLPAAGSERAAPLHA